MTITQARAIITAAHSDGRIDAETAQRAQAAITAKLYYGCAMTPRARASIIANRFGL